VKAKATRKRGNKNEASSSETATTKKDQPKRAIPDLNVIVDAEEMPVC
jgi:uncharacterized protein YhfF